MTRRGGYLWNVCLELETWGEEWVSGKKRIWNDLLLCVLLWLLVSCIQSCFLVFGWCGVCVCLCACVLSTEFINPSADSLLTTRTSHLWLCPVQRLLTSRPTIWYARGHNLFICTMLSGNYKYQELTQIHSDFQVLLKNQKSCPQWAGIPTWLPVAGNEH